MGNFNPQGYDVVIEVSEREVSRLAQARPPFATGLQPLPPRADGAEGTYDVALLVSDAWFRFEPGHPDTFRDDIDAISIRLQLRGEILITAIRFRGHRIEFPTATSLRIPLSARITIDDRLTVEASQAGGAETRNVAVDFSPDPGHPDEPRVTLDWPADGRMQVTNSVPFILQRVQDYLDGLRGADAQRAEDRRVQELEMQLRTEMHDRLVRQIKSISLLPQPVAVDPTTTDPFGPRELAVRTIAASMPHGSTLALLVLTGCPKVTTVVDSQEVTNLRFQIDVLQGAREGLNPQDRQDRKEIQRIGEEIAVLEAQLAAIPPGRRQTTITIPQAPNRAGPMSSALPPERVFALSISQWLLLRCVVRRSVIESIGLSSEDFDPLVPCRLAREIATAVRNEDGSVGDSYHLTRFEAVVEGDHLRIDGGVSKETWAYKGTAGFTLIIHLTVQEIQVDSEEAASLRGKIRDLRVARKEGGDTARIDRLIAELPGPARRHSRRPSEGRHAGRRPSGARWASPRSQSVGLRRDRLVGRVHRHRHQRCPALPQRAPRCAC